MTTPLKRQSFGPACHALFYADPLTDAEMRRWDDLRDKVICALEAGLPELGLTPDELEDLQGAYEALEDEAEAVAQSIEAVR